jgi:hypothetical protein
MKFYKYIKKNHKEHFFLKVIEFRPNDLKMCISTLRYDNVNNYDFLKLKNVLLLKIYLG